MLTVAMTATQRLKIFSLVGEQRGRSEEIWLFGKIIDKVVLSEDELKMVSYARNDSAGVVTWSPKADSIVAPHEIEFEDQEAGKLKDILQQWPQFTAIDRVWLKPLLDALGK